MSFWQLFLLIFPCISLSIFAQPLNPIPDKASLARDQVIAQIQNILPKMPSAKKAELYFRLGETYQEKASDAYAKEYRQFDIDYQKWIDGKRTGIEPKLSEYLVKSAGLRALALSQYQTVLQEYPHYERLDEVLYALAFSQYESGDKVQALQNYLALVERFPRSNYLADTYFALGEYYFNSNNVQKAFAAYAQAFRLGMLEKKTAIYIYALYKQAWCDFNENRFENALQKFQQVVLLSQEAKERQETFKTQGKDAVQLQQEALKDTLRLFAQLGQIEEAYLYFKANLGESEAVLWMPKLANAFQRLGMYEEEIATYVFLQKLSKAPTKSVSDEISILKAYVALEDKPNISLHAAAVSELCEENKSSDCDEAEVTVRNLASRYHRFANQSKAQDDYQLARQLYGAYLRAFATREKFGRMQFFLSELLWEIGEWELAASLYTEVFQKSSDEAFAKTAAVNAIVTWENVVGQGERPYFLKNKLVTPRSPPPQSSNIIFKKENDLKPIPISAAMQGLIAAIDRYMAFGKPHVFSKQEEEKRDEWAFKAALIYQRHFHFDEARERFAQLIKQKSHSKESTKAALLILDGLETNQKWDELAKATQLFLQEPDFLTDKQVKFQVMQFQEGARFNVILKAHENLTSKQDASAQKEESESIANQFEKFFQDFPQSRYGMKALYNAAIIYAQIPRYDLFVPLAEQWILLFKSRGFHDKESKQMAASLLSLLASIYEKTVSLEKSAEISEMYVTLFPNESLAKEMLYQAANTHVVLEQNSKAVELYLMYLEKYAKPEEMVEVQLSLAFAYENASQTENAIAVYQKVAKALLQKDMKQAIHTQYQVAKLYSKKADRGSLTNWCHKILQSIRLLKEIPDEGTIAEANAFCSYQVLESEWQSYQKIKLNVSFTQIKNQIQLKEKKMADLIKSYLRILEYKNAEWGMWSLHRVAEIQLNYVKSLREMPKPKSLGGEELELFLQELSDIVFPVEEEAILTLEKALEKAMELDLYSSVVKEIRNRLTELGVKKEKIVSVMPFFISTIPVGNLETKSSDYEIKIADIKKRLMTNSDDKNLLKQLAILYFEEKKWTLSNWVLDKLIQMDGEKAEFLNMKGLIYVEQSQFALAKAFFLRSVDLDEKRMDAWLNLGALSLKFGDKKSASEAYLKAAQIENTSAAALKGQEISKTEG